jgi:hypothetical protein
MWIVEVAMRAGLPIIPGVRGAVVNAIENKSGAGTAVAGGIIIVGGADAKLLPETAGCGGLMLCANGSGGGCCCTSVVKNCAEAAGLCAICLYKSSSFLFVSLYIDMMSSFVFVLPISGIASKKLESMPNPLFDGITLAESDLTDE